MVDAFTQMYRTLSPITRLGYNWADKTNQNTSKYHC